MGGTILGIFPFCLNARTRVVLFFREEESESDLSLILLLESQNGKVPAFKFYLLGYASIYDFPYDFHRLL